MQYDHPCNVYMKTEWPTKQLTFLSYPSETSPIRHILKWMAPKRLA